jgi:hypothetical protein
MSLAANHVQYIIIIIIIIIIIVTIIVRITGIPFEIRIGYLPIQKRYRWSQLD